MKIDKRVKHNIYPKKDLVILTPDIFIKDTDIQFGTYLDDNNNIEDLVLNDIQNNTFLKKLRKLKNIRVKNPGPNLKGIMFWDSINDSIIIDFDEDLKNKEIDEIIKKIDKLTLKKKNIFIKKNGSKNIYRDIHKDISLNYNYLPLILFTLFMLYNFYFQPNIGIDDYVRYFMERKYLLVFLFIIFFGMFQSIF